MQDRQDYQESSVEPRTESERIFRDFLQRIQEGIQHRTQKIKRRHLLAFDGTPKNPNPAYPSFSTFVAVVKR